VVRHISDDVAVMYLGQIVESATAEELFARPAHPYSRSLLSAIPVPDPTRRRQRVVLEGDVPTPLDPPAGCRFHTRCPAVMSRCDSEEPPALGVRGHHEVKCWHVEGLAEERDWFAVLERRIDEATARHTEATASAPRASRFALAADRAQAASDNARRVGRGGSGRSVAFLTQVAVVAGVLGALWILLGFVFTGAALVLAAVAGWRRTKSGRRAPASRTGFALAALVMCVVVSWGLSANERDRAARAQLDGLRRALVAVSEIRGEPPSRLAGLGWRLAEVFPSTDRVDPWGNAWKYRAPGAGGRPFELGSLGPDGVAGGEDDLGDSF